MKEFENKKSNNAGKIALDILLSLVVTAIIFLTLNTLI